MANVKEYNELMKQLKQGQYAPVYLLQGAEPYYIDKVCHYIENHAIEEHERDFNLSIFYGRDLDMGMLLDTLKRFPMMAERQVVIIREAQDYDGQWSELEAYMKQPTRSTVFVILYKYGKMDARIKWVKEFKNYGIALTTEKHYDNELPSLIAEFARGMKYRISDEAAYIMAEYLGNDLEKIEGELNKLTINIPISKEIDTADVKANIGISKDFSAMEFSDAIALGNVEKSYYIAHHIGRNEGNTPLPVIISFLFNQFSRLMMYHSLKDKSTSNVKRTIPGLYSDFLVGKVVKSARLYDARKCALIIEKLRETDGRFKGVNSAGIKDAELLKELTYFILSN